MGASDCDFPVGQAEIRAEERAEERRVQYLEINARSEYNKAICWKQLGGEQPCPQAVAQGSSPEREQGLNHCTKHVTNTAEEEPSNSVLRHSQGHTHYCSNV